MNEIYSILDGSDGKVLLTIATQKKCATALTSIKKNTDRIWYANSNDGKASLSSSDITLLDTAINGDWNEIFEALLKIASINYTILTVTEI